MKRKILSLMFAMSLIVSAVYAVETGERESLVSVDFSQTTEIAPDTAKIKFYVENSGINLNDIKEKNDKIVNEAVKKIKEKLSENESVKTIAFSVNNVYSFKDKVRIFQKYEVKNGFEVKLKDMSKISEIVKIAMDSGIKNIGQLNFAVENGQKTCNDMMIQVTKNAKERAQLIAETAGVQLDRPKSISPYCSLNNNFVQPRLYNSAFGASKMADTAAESEIIESIEPGNVSVRAGVNMTYYLK